MSQLRCQNCSKPLPVPPASAPHKKFCSTSCRYQFHNKRRDQALAELRAREQAEAEAKAKAERRG